MLPMAYVFAAHLPFSISARTATKHNSAQDGSQLTAPVTPKRSIANQTTVTSRARDGVVCTPMSAKPTLFRQLWSFLPGSRSHIKLDLVEDNMATELVGGKSHYFPPNLIECMHTMRLGRVEVIRRY